MKIIYILLILFISNPLFAQQYYQVTTDVLNVRSSADKNSEIISKLNLGDSIYVVEYSDGWSQVRLNETTTGFVASKYLSKDFKSSEISELRNNTKSTPTDFSPLIYLAIVAIGLYIVYRRYKRKCKECGRWYAMKITDEEVVDRVSASVKKTIKEKNGQGEIIKTKEIYIPATKTKYLVTETCKYCGHEKRYYNSETKEN